METLLQDYYRKQRQFTQELLEMVGETLALGLIALTLLAVLIYLGNLI